LRAQRVADKWETSPGSAYATWKGNPNPQNPTNPQAPMTKRCPRRVERNSIVAETLSRRKRARVDRKHWIDCGSAERRPTRKIFARTHW